MAYMAYTMVGAGLTPALLATFLWKRVTASGAVSSIVAGMSTVLVVNVFRTSLARQFHWMAESDYDIYPAIVASFSCLIVVSLLSKPSPPEKVEPFLAAARGDGE
jgi:SSS family solute:Na+ symporter/sodium/proline symporter